MYEVAICDDNKYCLDEMEQIILTGKNLTNEQIHIVKFQTGEELCEYALTHTIHQIYLDIELDKMNGVEVAHFFREKLNDYHVKIIFMTGTTEYDRELFEVQTFAFLEKPVKKEKAIDYFLKAYKLDNRNNQKFIYTNENMKKFICYKDILFFCKNNRDIEIHTFRGEDDWFGGTIKKLEKDLEGTDFVKISRSVIVNLHYIDKMEKNLLWLKNGAKLEISRKFQKDVKNTYCLYLLR